MNTKNICAVYVYRSKNVLNLKGLLINIPLKLFLDLLKQRLMFTFHKYKHIYCSEVEIVNLSTIYT